MKVLFKESERLFSTIYECANSLAQATLDSNGDRTFQSE
jgi:hypothetical protein